MCQLALIAVLQAALVVRLVRERFYMFPWLTIYLGAMVFQAIHWLSFWGIGWEIGLAMLAAATTWESVRLSSWVITRDYERGYGIWFTVFATCMFVGAGLFSAPTPYPGWPRGVYFVHLFTDLTCFAWLATSLLYHWVYRTKVLAPFVWNNAILMIWFLGHWWRDTQLEHTYPIWFRNSIGMEFVVIWCLLAWHAKIIHWGRMVNYHVGQSAAVTAQDPRPYGS